MNRPNTLTYTLVVRTPRLDGSSSAAVMSEAEIAFESGARLLVIDLSRVKFIDSLGVAALASIAGLAPRGARVRLAALSAYANTVARVTHLDEIVEVYANVEAALG